MNVIWIQLRTFQACENLFMGHIVHDGLMEKKPKRCFSKRNLYRTQKNLEDSYGILIDFFSNLKESLRIPNKNLIRKLKNIIS